VDHGLSVLVEDADVGGSGVEIDPTVVEVLGVVESHEADPPPIRWGTCSGETSSI